MVEKDAAPSIELKHSKMTLQLRPATSQDKKQEILEAWYRQQLRLVAPPLIAQWEHIIGVKSGKLFVQKMKTKWGSCSPGPKHIRLNTDLAKKPLPCLEYIVVHELTHLLERQHSDRFTALMDAHLPQWRQYRALLNTLPLTHQARGY